MRTSEKDESEARNERPSHALPRSKPQNTRSAASENEHVPFDLDVDELASGARAAVCGASASASPTRLRLRSTVGAVQIPFVSQMSSTFLTLAYGRQREEQKAP